MSSPPRDSKAGPTTEVAATFEYLGKPPTPARATILARGPRERTLRALRALGACWGLAIVAVFIPVLHFVLVPSLLLAGPLIASSLNQERVTVIEARGACPACAHEQTVALGRGARPRIDFRCEKCGRPLALALPPEVLERAPS
jgi:hypothetical protein